MNDTWDLSILYKGFDDPAFTGDMAALDAAIRSMNDLAAQAAALPHADLVHRYVDGQLQLTNFMQTKVQQHRVSTTIPQTVSVTSM